MSRRGSIAPARSSPPGIPGQEAGAALADLLFGDANFSGRLPISWERRSEDNPSFAHYYYNEPQHPNQIVYREGVFIGYRGFQKSSVKPLFPFGFGLSYTTFRYSNLKVAPAAPGSGSLYAASFDVTNTGTRAGADVAQIYVGAAAPKVPRPARELKGFARVSLAPGETKHVTLPLDARSFAYFDVRGKEWRADAGRYTVELGHSSESIEAHADVSLPRALQVPISAALAPTADTARAHIDAGDVQGASVDGVVAFKGIPFALPPVGALRWRPPQPVKSWTGSREATQFGPDCAQEPFPGDAAPLGVGADEDCLYVNVWTPAKRGTAKLPVMVWIYGGGFVNGGSSPAVYDGTPFAKDGVVLVSFNYRLGHFGFFAHPGIERRAGRPAAGQLRAHGPAGRTAMGAAKRQRRSAVTRRTSRSSANPPAACPCMCS